MPKGGDTLDAIDLKLLQLLHRDGRMSNSRLAEVACLSQSACFQRIKRLEKKKYITGYVANLAVEKINSTTITIYTLIKLGSDQIPVVTEFENFVRALPEVTEWHAIVGEHDYLLRFVVVSLDRYRQIVNDMMSRPLQVTSYTSHVVHRSGAKPLDVSSLRGSARSAHAIADDRR
jgi:Lrp/AsnC family transcriptional regulator of ectoine degradation